MSQEDFACRIGTSRQRVSRVERGKAEYTLSQLLTIEQLTGIPTAELLNALESHTPVWLKDYLALSHEQRRMLDGFIVNGIHLVKHS